MIDDAEKVLNKQLGQRLREARQSISMSQQTLAKHLGISYQMLAKIEAGSCRLGAARLLQAAKILNFPAGFLLQGFAFQDPQPPRPLSLPELQTAAQATQNTLPKNPQTQAASKALELWLYLTQPEAQSNL